MRPSVRRSVPALAAALLFLPAFATLAVDSTTTDSTATPAAGATAAPTPPAEPADAASRFRTLVGLQAADLERAYRAQDAAYDRLAADVAALRTRIADVDSAGRALFAEWDAELAEMGGETLRAASQVRRDSAQARFDRHLAGMREAEAAAAPALADLRDHTLALKHTLDARAVSALDGTATSVETEANRLLQEAERAADRAEHALAAANPPPPAPAGTPPATTPPTGTPGTGTPPAATPPAPSR